MIIAAQYSVFLILLPLLSLLINHRQTRLSWIYHVIIADQILTSLKENSLHS